MTPTPAQEKLLKEYLRKILDYRETCDEFYDHILTAIAHSGSGATFEQQINEVINQDFCGAKNLRKVESSFKKNATGVYFKKYLASVLYFLRFPRLIYLLTFSLCIYLIRDLIQLPYEIFLWLYFAHYGLIFGYYLFRQFKIGSRFRDRKKSITDTAFSRLLNFPVQIFIASLLLYNLRNMAGITNFKILYFPDYYSAAALSIGLTIYLLHTIAILKLLKDEFKEVAI